MMTSSNGNIFRVTGFSARNSPVTGELPSQRPVTRNFDVFLGINYIEFALQTSVVFLQPQRQQSCARGVHKQSNNGRHRIEFVTLCNGGLLNVCIWQQHNRPGSLIQDWAQLELCLLNWSGPVSKYRNSQCEDKTMVKPSCLLTVLSFSRNPCAAKMAFVLNRPVPQQMHPYKCQFCDQPYIMHQWYIYIYIYI